MNRIVVGMLSIASVAFIGYYSFVESKDPNRLYRFETDVLVYRDAKSKAAFARGASPEEMDGLRRLVLVERKIDIAKHGDSAVFLREGPEQGLVWVTIAGKAGEWLTTKADLKLKK